MKPKLKTYRLALPPSAFISMATLEEQLYEVSSAFTDQLKQKVALLEATWKSIDVSQEINIEALHILSDVAHELHGQGTFFGYPKVTDYAGQLEEICDVLIQASDIIPAEAKQKITRHIHQLKETATIDNGTKELFQNDKDALKVTSEYRKQELFSAQPRRILLIDDADTMRKRIALTLREAGFDVLEAANGLTGIDLAIQTTPDLILLDIKMPEVDGFEVQRKIRSHKTLEDIPLIFITSLGRVSIAQIQEALSYGITDYIAKPFKMAKLLEKVKKGLQDG